MGHALAAALAAALVGSACGGGEEAGEAQAPPTAADQPRAKPARREPIRAAPSEPAQRPDPAAGQEPPPPSADWRPSIPPDAPIPEGTRPLSRLPDDVPMPPGVRSASPLVLSEGNIAHGTFETDGSVASATTSYTTGLLQNGWSIEPGPQGSGNQALISATKGDRQLSIAIEGGSGATQIVIFEMQKPEP
jgi:hypothetical protein